MLNKKWFVLFPVGVMLCGCQDEEFGFSYEEIHQTVVEREYIKAFNAEFPEIDPNHTWMCTPDTFYYNNVGITRAGVNPEITKSDSKILSLTLSAVSAALSYMEEAEDNRGKCAQNFEYLAVETTTYEISPTFWKEKFCDDNEVGIYYMNGDQKVELPPFWNDKTTNIYAVFTDGAKEMIARSTHPIFADPQKSTYNKWPELKHDGHSIDHFELPVFELTVPAGVKWGLYLVTNKTQNNNSPRVTWYSNSSFNPDGYKAAATFTFGGVTYCSFEDAPHNCNGTGTGSCGSCGYGHYDHDYNDIVLTITPRPIESTYRAIKYRVMCEDLGGTFDWDFNDVVYDVIYEDGKGANINATVSIVLQAVGGTLPIYIKYSGLETNKFDNTDIELHKLLSGQSPDDHGLYTPVNVKTNEYETITGKNPQTVKTIELAKPQYSDAELDVRQYVKNVTVEAVQEGIRTSKVIFPLEGADAIPQCFMTSTGTEWADELQPITDKYDQFRKWVASQQKGDQWWNSDPNF